MFSLITHFINAQIRTDTCIQTSEKPPMMSAFPEGPGAESPSLRLTWEIIGLTHGHKRTPPCKHTRLPCIYPCGSRGVNKSIVFTLSLQNSLLPSLFPCSLLTWPLPHARFRQSKIICNYGSRDWPLLFIIILFYWYFHVNNTLFCHCNCQAGSQAQIHQQQSWQRRTSSSLAFHRISIDRKGNSNIVLVVSNYYKLCASTFSPLLLFLMVEQAINIHLVRWIWSIWWQICCFTAAIHWAFSHFGAFCNVWMFFQLFAC